MIRRARVTVMPKDGVLDPAGRAIAAALHGLGYAEVCEVRVGKVITLELEDDGGATAEAVLRARATEMARRLLANLVVERFDVELAE